MNKSTGFDMLDDTQDYRKRLRDAFGCFPSGVTVVTLRDGEGRPTGITVNSFSSLSLDPPLLMFSVGCQQVSCRWFEAQDCFTVNVLAAGQESLAWQFARPMKDKFEGVDWREGANGTPVLEGAIAGFECRKWSMMDGGDHKIVVGEITDFSSAEGDALVFFRGAMREAARGV
jgi:flavin reductase (DIM6/NTAB) family NADH-FMN oxidoreductase RutF